MAAETEARPDSPSTRRAAALAERPTKVKGLYLCGPIQFMDPLPVSLLCGPFTPIYGLSVTHGALSPP